MIACLVAFTVLLSWYVYSRNRPVLSPGPLADRFVYLYASIGLLLLPMAVVHASSATADSVHFCLPVDFERWERDGPRPAAKRPADRNVGEPRTVRMIYVLPNDRVYRPDVADSMKTAIRQVQAFFAEQMGVHGYGAKSFRFETDADGEPLVHRVDGAYPDRHYIKNTERAVIDEVVGRTGRPGEAFGLDDNVLLVVIDNSINGIALWNGVAQGVGAARGKKAGLTIVSAAFSWQVMAHELGHAFGLHHDFNDNAYIMSYGGGQRRSLSACGAEFLSVNPFFNPNVPIEQGQSPRVKRLSPVRYRAGASSITAQLEARAEHGLHQAILTVLTRPGHPAANSPEVKACRGLDGAREAIIEFDYDGVVPSGGISSISDSPVHVFRVDIVDKEGNISPLAFELAERSPFQIATLEMGLSVVSMALSPDGSVLAVGGGEGNVVVWNIATRAKIATLPREGPANSISMLAFWPDGATVAAANSLSLNLWDVETTTRIATFRPPLELKQLFTWALSPDGVTVACGIRAYNNVRRDLLELWNMKTETRIASRGHSALVLRLQFSPDGTILASGAGQIVRLWDTATQTEIASLEHSTEVTWVRFSPDGNTLAVGTQHSVALWDVPSREQNAKFPIKEWGFDATFSRDGKTLIASDGRQFHIWDLVTQEKMDTIPQPGGLRGLVISPDGTVVITGLNTFVTLWTVPGRTPPPYPVELTKPQGDHQEGTSGRALAEPLVVSVLDQNGEPLAGVIVRFSVTRGGGMLSQEQTSTDVRGEATSFLTLGSRPGTNTVAVSVAGLEPVTFSAVGLQAATDFDGDGTVGFGDFLQFAAQFGLSTGDAGYEARFDLDGDGAIGFGDFLIFANDFGNEASSS